MSVTINWQNKIIHVKDNKEILVEVGNLITNFKIPSDKVIEFITGSENILKFGDFIFKKSWHFKKIWYNYGIFKQKGK